MSFFTIEEKKEILRSFIAKFEKEVSALDESARAAHEAATHEESKAEDAHDTRGLEASYLAGAQAARVSELKQVIHEYKLLLDSQSKVMDRIAIGSIVRVQMLEDEGGKAKGTAILALYASKGGGTTIETQKGSISVLSPHSPLGEAILDAKSGDEASIESKAGNRYYRVESVC